MNNESKKRSYIVYKNIFSVLFSQCIIIFLGFLTRRVFISSLSIHYLGYNSVFASILQMLNLADLGVGVAITSFLYKPIADGNKKEINDLLYLYKKIYHTIGISISILGFFISFFLMVFIHDSNDPFWYIAILFYINLAATVSSYFLAYKRTLLIADQKTYITSKIDMKISILFGIVQIASLLYFKNYILYSLLSLAKNVFSNYIISKVCNREYPYLDSKNVNIENIKVYRKRLISFMKDIMISKFGSYIYYSTDNLVISFFKSSLLAGYLSNYTLVITQVNTVVSQVLSSVQSTLALFIYNNKDIERQKNIVDCYLFIDFFIGCVCMTCIIFLMQPFVTLWLGEEFLLGISTLILLAVNLMLTILITLPSQLFTIYKLFHFDKIVIIISAILNLLISSILVNFISIDGVLIGTLVTSLIYLYSRFYIISIKIYKISFFHYLKKTIKYFIISFVLILYITVIVRDFSSKITILNFMKLIIMVSATSVVIPTLFTINTREFNHVLELFFPYKINCLVQKNKTQICILLISFLILLFLYTL